MTGREKFEAWAVENKLSLCQGLYGGYAFGDTASSWKAWQAALASQQPADDGWIEWRGGRCPVDGELRVETKLRCGIYSDADEARMIYWNQSGRGSDIIAYRVVKP